MVVSGTEVPATLRNVVWTRGGESASFLWILMSETGKLGSSVDEEEFTKLRFRFFLIITTAKIVKITTTTPERIPPAM